MKLRSEVNSPFIILITYSCYYFQEIFERTSIPAIIDNGIKKENDLIRLARAPQIIQLADLDVAWSDVTFHSSIFRRATLETVVVTRVIHTLTSKRKRRKEKKRGGISNKFRLKRDIAQLVFIQILICIVWLANVRGGRKNESIRMADRLIHRFPPMKNLPPLRFRHSFFFFFARARRWQKLYNAVALNSGG